MAQIIELIAAKVILFPDTSKIMKFNSLSGGLLNDARKQRNSYAIPV